MYVCACVRVCACMHACVHVHACVCVCVLNNKNGGEGRCQSQYLNLFEKKEKKENLNLVHPVHLHHIAMSPPYSV